MILPHRVGSARDLTYKTKIPRAGATRKVENRCAVHVLVHRERQPATKDNIVIVKLCGILYITSKPVVRLCIPTVAITEACSNQEVSNRPCARRMSTCAAKGPDLVGRIDRPADVVRSRQAETPDGTRK